MDSIMKPDKRKSVVNLIAFVFFMCIGGSLLCKIGNNFIIDNLTSIVYSILFVITIFLFGKNIWAFVCNIKLKYVKDLVIIGVLTFFANAFSGILLSILDITNNNQESIENAIDYNTVFFYITIIIFAPVVEEVVYRYCIFGLLKKYPFLGHIISSLLFAFIHVWDYVLIDGQWLQLVSMLPYLVLGLGLSILYQRTQNLIFPIVLHMLINSIAVFS